MHTSVVHNHLYSFLIFTLPGACYCINYSMYGTFRFNAGFLDCENNRKYMTRKTSDRMTVENFPLYKNLIVKFIIVLIFISTN